MAKTKISNINEIIQKENSKNISEIVNRIYINRNKLDLIFWNGAGFVKYISGLNGCTWSDFLSSKYISLKITDFFTLSQIDFNYKKQIESINKDVKKKKFKNSEYHNFVKTLQHFSYSLSNGRGMKENNFRINFMTTNHCKSMEEYFEINNIFYMHDLRGSIESAYNCFYLHSLDENDWIYQLKHYKEFILSKVSYIYDFFSDYFSENYRIIFLFGSSLNEIHLLILLYCLNNNEKCLVINIRQIRFNSEFKNTKTGIQQIKNDLLKFNIEMLGKHSIYNLFVLDGDEYDSLWKIFTEELTSLIETMFPPDICKFFSKYEDIPTVGEMISQYNKKSVSEKVLILDAFLKNKNFQILSEIWNNYFWDHCTLNWYVKKTLTDHKYFKKYDIYEFISKFNSFAHNVHKKIFEILNVFITKKKITNIEIKQSEMNILSFIKSILSYSFLSETSLEMCIKTTILIFKKENRFNYWFRPYDRFYYHIFKNIFEYKNIDLRGIIIKSISDCGNSLLDKYVILDMFNFLYKNFNNCNPLSFEDIFIELKKSLEDFLMIANERNVAIFLSLFFSSNKEKFKELLCSKMKNDNTAPMFYLIMRVNKELKNHFSKEYSILKKRYENKSFFNVEFRTSYRNSNEIQPKVSNKNIIDKWNFDNSNVKKIIMKIAKPDKMAYENEDSITYFFDKIFSDLNVKNKCHNLETFFNEIIKNEEILEIVQNYYSFFSKIYVKTYHGLIILLGDNLLDESSFKKIINILGKFRKYSEWVFLTNDEKIICNKKLVFKVITIAFQSRQKNLIKSVLSFFINEKDAPYVYDLSLKINNIEINLFEILSICPNKKDLKDILEYAWPNNSHNDSIIDIIYGSSKDEINILKLLLIKNDKTQEEFQGELIKYEKSFFKFIDFIYRDDRNGEHEIRIKMNYYHQFIQTILSFCGISKMKALVFSTNNIQLLEKCKFLQEFVRQLVFLVEKKTVFSKTELKFLKINSKKIIIDILDNIKMTHWINIETFVVLINILFENCSEKILDIYFTKIANELIQFKWIHEKKDYSNDIRRILVLAVFLYKKIINKITIKNELIYKFMETNENYVRLEFHCIKELEKKFLEYLKETK